MDNKITKTRLSNFLAYEWIFMLVMIIVAVIVMELIFAMASVRLTVGQTFSIYYDENIISTNHDGFKKLLNENDTFSFDVLDVGQESLMSEQNVLYLRLSTQEGDIIITDNADQKVDEETSVTRAKSLIDTYDMYDMDELYRDACIYLHGFLKDEYNSKYKTPEASDYPKCPEYSELDEEKIEKGFHTRLGKDNRFRKKDKKAEGIKLEKQRIEKLCGEVALFKKLLDLDTELYNSTNGEQSYFMYYTKCEQSRNIVEVKEKPAEEEKYKKALEENKKKYNGRETARYALKADMIRKSKDSQATKRSVDEFFRFGSYEEGADVTETAKNVVIEVFNFRTFQPELQFECISFMNTIVTSCSDILD